jgi:UDP-glucose 4-epimerase
MRIMVTGGAGYIGSHTVEVLISRGYDVVVFDNLQTGHLAAIHENATFIKGNLLDPKQITQAFDQHPIDAIIHFASNTLVGESMSKPWLYLRDNILAASNLVEEATKRGISRFIFSSSSNMFSGPADAPITSSTIPRPASPYGESKAIIERILYWAHQLYGLRYSCLRYFNAAGAHPRGHIGEDHSPETHLIPLVIQVAMGQRDCLTVFGNDYPTSDGTCIRDYIHVMDLADAHVLVMEALESRSSITYNLGNGTGYSVLDVIRTTERITGSRVSFEVGPRRLGDPPELICDPTEAENDLGWVRKFGTLDEIVRTAWRWHSSHPHGHRA